MARKAEPKFKIVSDSYGTFVDGKYQLIPEMRLDNVHIKEISSMVYNDGTTFIKNTKPIKFRLAKR